MRCRCRRCAYDHRNKNRQDAGAERKAAQRAEWAKTKADRERECREHPVPSGAVKVVDYVEPSFGYRRPASWQAEVVADLH